MFAVGITLANFSSKARFWRISVNVTFCEGKSDPSPIISNLVTRTSAQKLQYWLTHFSALRKLVET